MTAKLPSFMQGSKPEANRYGHAYDGWPEEVRGMVDEMIDYMAETGNFFTSTKVANNINSHCAANDIRCPKINGHSVVSYARNVRDLKWSEIVAK